MTEWIRNVYHANLWGNSLQQGLYAMAAMLLLFILLQLLFGLLKRRVGSLSRKTANVLDDLVAAALESTKSYVLLFVAIWGGAQLLDFGDRGQWLDIMLLITVVLQLAIWLNRMVSSYIAFYTVSRREDNPGAVSVVQGVSFLVRLIIWSVAFLLVIDNLGYDVTALFAGLGIGGIAVALAVQNILGDLFASLSIVLDKPFVIGDFIIVDDLMGVVEQVGLKTTRLRSLSGEQLIFSNTDLLNSRVRNYKRMQECRVPFAFGVIYQTTPDQLEAIPSLVQSIVESVEGLRFDRAHFKSFGDSSYDFEVVYYINTPDFNAYMDAQQTINLSLCREFAARGVEFAYPTRTLFIQREDGASESAS